MGQNYPENIVNNIHNTNNNSIDVGNNTQNDWINNSNPDSQNIVTHLSGNQYLDSTSFASQPGGNNFVYRGIVNNNLIAQNPIGNDYANVNQNSFVNGNGSNNQHFFNDNFINQNAGNNQNNFVNRNNISSTPMVNNGLTTFIEPTKIIIAITFSPTSVQIILLQRLVIRVLILLVQIIISITKIPPSPIVSITTI